MIHARVWRTMTTLTVEITCHHGGRRPSASHLIVREIYEAEGPDDQPLDVLQHTAALAAWAHQRGDVELSDECGW